MSRARTCMATLTVLLGMIAPVISQTRPASDDGHTQPVQLTRRTPEELARISAATHVIHLNVVVLNATGNPVASLDKSDFRILADSQPQTIAGFEDFSRPVRILLVLDAINNKAGDYAEERKAIGKFLGQNGGTQPFAVSLVRIAPDGMIVEPPERDTALLKSELESLPGPETQNESEWPGELTDSPNMSRGLPTTTTGSPNLSGSTTSSHTAPSVADTHPASQDARFVESLNQLEKIADREQDFQGRVVLIWLGPGWPLLNDSRFLPDTEQIKTRYFDHLVGLSTELRAAEITLDAVASPKLLSDAALRPNYADAYLAPVLSSDNIEAGNLSLPTLALLSGGRVIDSEKEVAKAIAQCADDANDAYRLTFLPSPAEKLDEYRRIQVLVNRPGLTTRTVTGFYAEP